MGKVISLHLLVLVFLLLMRIFDCPIDYTDQSLNIALPMYVVLSIIVLLGARRSLSTDDVSQKHVRVCALLRSLRVGTVLPMGIGLTLAIFGLFLEHMPLAYGGALNFAIFCLFCAGYACSIMIEEFRAL